MKIGIGADHRGYQLKNKIVKFLQEQREKVYKVYDYGSFSSESIDYPDIAFRVAEDVARRRLKFGILLCFSGQGMVITANKVKGIRAALCPKPVFARLARAHNNANILVLPAGFVKFNKELKKTITVFLNTDFEGGRHKRRINKIKKYERQSS